MSKKYLKNENGAVRAMTTDNLQLEKPLLNENYDIDVYNRNMDKIDNAIQEVKGKIDGLELVASNVKMDNGTTVEDAVLANKSSILDNAELANQALNKANEAFQRGDNVKTQLVDKLISEGLNVSTNNTFEELIGGIALGKKWASGTVDITTSKISFNGTWGSTHQDYYAEVNGLSFKPSTVILYNEEKAVKTVYNVGETYNSRQIVTSNRIEFRGGSIHSYAFYTTSPCVIENGGFIVPVLSTNITAPFNMSWVAFE